MKTPNIELPELSQSESPAYVNLNDGFRALDALVQLTVESRSISAPPTVEQGARDIVATGPTGAWVGHARHVAYKTALGWDFRIPRKGWAAFVLDEGDDTRRHAVYFDGLNWVDLIFTFGIGDLSDVDFVTEPEDGDSLVFDAGLGKWVSAPPVSSLDSLTDVDTTGAEDGDSLVYNEGSGTWVPFAVAAGGGGLNDPYFYTGVEILFGFEGSNGATVTTDDSAAVRSATFNGNAQISTAQAKFGSSSLKLDGTGDYLQLSGRAVLGVASRRFTIECWIRIDVNNRQQTICSKRPSVGQSEFTWAIDATGHLFVTAWDTSVSVLSATGTTVLSTGTWYHVAVSRADNRWRIFVDGVIEATALETADPVSTSDPFVVGRETTNTARDFQGHMDEFRFTSGVCRYVENFTPPTLAFPRS